LFYSSVLVSVASTSGAASTAGAGAAATSTVSSASVSAFASAVLLANPSFTASVTKDKILSIDF
jgi:hypothetical protein